MQLATSPGETHAIKPLYFIKSKTCCILDKRPFLLSLHQISFFYRALLIQIINESINSSKGDPRCRNIGNIWHYHFPLRASSYLFTISNIQLLDSALIIGKMWLHSLPFLGMVYLSILPHRFSPPFWRFTAKCRWIDGSRWILQKSTNPSHLRWDGFWMDWYRCNANIRSPPIISSTFSSFVARLIPDPRVARDWYGCNTNCQYGPYPICPHFSFASYPMPIPFGIRSNWNETTL